MNVSNDLKIIKLDNKNPFIKPTRNNTILFNIKKQENLFFIQLSIKNDIENMPNKTLYAFIPLEIPIKTQTTNNKITFFIEVFFFINKYKNKVVLITPIVFEYISGPIILPVNQTQGIDK